MDRWGLGYDKGNGVGRDRHQSGWIEKYKEIEVDRQDTETNIGRYTKNRVRSRKRVWKI